MYKLLNLTWPGQWTTFPWEKCRMCGAGAICGKLPLSRFSAHQHLDLLRDKKRKHSKVSNKNPSQLYSLGKKWEAPFFFRFSCQSRHVVRVCDILPILCCLASKRHSVFKNMQWPYTDNIWYQDVQWNLNWSNEEICYDNMSVFDNGEIFEHNSPVHWKDGITPHESWDHHETQQWGGAVFLVTLAPLLIMMHICVSRRVRRKKIHPAMKHRSVDAITGWTTCL